MTFEKDQKDTTFIYAFPYCDMDKGIIMEEPGLLIEVIVTGIMAEKQLRELLIIVAEL